MDLGGIYVIAHVRGSEGFGEDWRRAGQLEKKTKSISDFIDVAQYLVHSGWATPGMLSCAGESAGGIVIGGAIAARPDLFSAAVIRAGLVNAMRLERIPIGPFNTGEFGSTKTKAGAQMLYAIDAYQHIKEGTAYPGVLLIVGRNDTRVSPWMSAKLAARLQASNAGPRPVLLQVQDQGDIIQKRESRLNRNWRTYTRSSWGKQVSQTFSRMQHLGPTDNPGERQGTKSRSSENARPHLTLIVFQLW